MAQMTYFDCAECPQCEKQFVAGSAGVILFCKYTNKSLVLVEEKEATQ